MKIYILIEALVALMGLILAALACGRLAGRTRPRFLPSWLPGAARRPFVVILGVGVLGFGASALVTVFTGTPQPRFHDEFSYLLAADTFAHGRLTNPSHPLWEHFETVHVIQQPTYASKYPPGQGLVLALGQAVFGHPIVGVWLSVAMACAAITWMLAGWCPLRWAGIGGLVAVVRIVFSGSSVLGEWASIAYWSQSYWGGTVAALGGALVFGALPRILKKESLRAALCLALGLAILANSRPFEGLVVTVPVMAVLGIWAVRTRKVGWGVLFRRILLPVVLVLFLTALWMGFYNFRVTGDPFRMPYQVHESTYAAAPFFLWQPLQTAPSYNHKTLQEFYVGWARRAYLRQQSFSGWISMAWWKVASLWWFFIGPLFTPFFAALPKMLHRRSVQFALGTWALLIVAFLTETWTFPHYVAPATSLAFLLIVESLRQARLAPMARQGGGKGFDRVRLAGASRLGSRLIRLGAPPRIIGLAPWKGLECFETLSKVRIVIWSLFVTAPSILPMRSGFTTGRTSTPPGWSGPGKWTLRRKESFSSTSKTAASGF